MRAALLWLAASICVAILLTVMDSAHAGQRNADWLNPNAGDAGYNVLTLRRVEHHDRRGPEAMSDFYTFASLHPILTLILAIVVVGGIVQIVASLTGRG